MYNGSPSGYQTNRAQIALYGNDGKTVAYIRFNDPDMHFENDSQSAGRIKMHRSKHCKTVDCKFTTADARVKLKKLYPTIGKK